MTDNERIELNEIISGANAPAHDGEPIFHAPWQARLFGIAVALTESHAEIEWEDFQRLLVNEIERDDVQNQITSEKWAIETAYYEQWQRALERLVIEKGLVDVDAFDERIDDFASGVRTAAEFVEGKHERDPGEEFLHIHRGSSPD